jgi:hypothetical protein
MGPESSSRQGSRVPRVEHIHTLRQYNRSKVCKNADTSGPRRCRLCNIKTLNRAYGSWTLRWLRAQVLPPRKRVRNLLLGIGPRGTHIHVLSSHQSDFTPRVTADCEDNPPRRTGGTGVLAICKGSAPGLDVPQHPDTSCRRDVHETSCVIFGFRWLFLAAPRRSHPVHPGLLGNRGKSDAFSFACEYIAHFYHDVASCKHVGGWISAPVGSLRRFLLQFMQVTEKDFDTVGYQEWQALIPNILSF